MVSAGGAYFRLGEIAEIVESYARPARNKMKIDNVPAVGIAISTVADGNVVEMVELVAAEMEALKAEMPEGYRLQTIYDQGYESAVANDGFVLNLILSVITVVGVLLFFIGVKNGFLVGSGLVFSIFGTLIYMQATGIALQRMSLAAIIIAMGMLVDNVYLSPHITGELLSSLFIVIAVSLLLSWVLAITQNVFFVQEFVRRPRREELKGELFTGRMYDFFRRALRITIQKRHTVLVAMVGLLVLAGWGFRFIPQQFMPMLNKQYFSVDMWLPEGTRIEETERQIAELSAFIQGVPGVKQVSSFVGQTPPRYYLANAAYGPQPNYGQCLVETATPEESRKLQQLLYDELPQKFPDALTRVNRFEVSSIPQALIEARFCGDDPKVLNARNEWGNMAMMVKAGYDPIKAGRLNIGKSDMMNSVKAVNDLPVWNGTNSAPLGQVTDGISFHFIEQAKPQSLIVFTTAYDEYAVRAFTVNSIDYLLKPIQRERLSEAIAKYESLAGTYLKELNEAHELLDVLKNLNTPEKKYRTRFLIAATEKFYKLSVDDIAYFYTGERLTFAVTHSGKEHIIDLTLERLCEQLDPDKFFRANRQLVLNIDAITRIEPYFQNRIVVHVKPEFKEKILISREKITAFKLWLNY